VRLLNRSRDLLNSLGASGQELQTPTQDDPKSANPTQDMVENEVPSADKLPLEGILLIEGLRPGANLDS
jgi:hypothetical protein